MTSGDSLATPPRCAVVVAHDPRARTVGRWITRQLRAFRTPRELVAGGKPARIVVESDAEKADFLLAVCSSPAHESIDRAIARFSESRPLDRVIPLVIAGDDVEAALPPLLAAQAESGGELLAAMIPARALLRLRMGDELLRIAAAILDCSLDALRDRRRRRQRAAIATAIATLLFIVTLGLVARFTVRYVDANDGRVALRRGLPFLHPLLGSHFIVFESNVLMTELSRGDADAVAAHPACLPRTCRAMLDRWEMTISLARIRSDPGANPHWEADHLLALGAPRPEIGAALRARLGDCESFVPAGIEETLRLTGARPEEIQAAMAARLRCPGSTHREAASEQPSAPAPDDPRLLQTAIETLLRPQPRSSIEDPRAAEVLTTAGGTRLDPRVREALTGRLDSRLVEEVRRGVETVERLYLRDSDWLREMRARLAASRTEVRYVAAQTVLRFDPADGDARRTMLRVAGVRSHPELLLEAPTVDVRAAGFLLGLPGPHEDLDAVLRERLRDDDLSAVLEFARLLANRPPWKNEVDAALLTRVNDFAPAALLHAADMLMANGTTPPELTEALDRAIEQVLHPPPPDPFQPPPPPPSGGSVFALAARRLAISRDAPHLTAVLRNAVRGNAEAYAYYILIGGKESDDDTIRRLLDALDSREAALSADYRRALELAIAMVPNTPQPDPARTARIERALHAWSRGHPEVRAQHAFIVRMMKQYAQQQPYFF